MTAELYRASPIKRLRATKAEVEGRREALLDIIEAGRPMTVRQVFYQATVHGLVEKAESGYGKVQTDLTVMRRAGELPDDWLADNTRWQRKICPPARPKPRTPAPKRLAAPFPSSLTPSSRTNCARWCRKRSSVICRPSNSRS